MCARHSHGQTDTHYTLIRKKCVRVALGVPRLWRWLYLGSACHKLFEPNGQKDGWRVIQCPPSPTLLSHISSHRSFPDSPHSQEHTMLMRIAMQPNHANGLVITSNDGYLITRVYKSLSPRPKMFTLKYLVNITITKNLKYSKSASKIDCSQSDQWIQND